VEDVIDIGSMQDLHAREGELEAVGLIMLDIDLGDGTTLDWATGGRRRANRA